MKTQFALAAVLFLAVPSMAGDLTPPAGPVAPTMKTLEQVEPRTPLSQADVPIVITEPGSYYLTENLSPNANIGDLILIDADHVTLDLRGFSLINKPNGDSNLYALRGISVNTGISGARIMNGFTFDFWRGISASTAIATSVESVHALGATTDGRYGICVGEASIVRNCTAADLQEIGITADDGSLIIGSTVHFCQTGIWANGGTIIDSCVVRNCGIYGIVSTSGAGLAAGHIRNSVAVDGQATGIIVAATGASVRMSAAIDNAGSGISVVGESAVITGSTSTGNGGHGIEVSGDFNRVDDNTVTGNTQYGIEGTGTGNTVTRNHASGNGGLNYNIAPGNSVGTITNTPVGAGAWDNFEF